MPTNNNEYRRVPMNHYHCHDHHHDQNDQDDYNDHDHHGHDRHDDQDHHDHMIIMIHRIIIVIIAPRMIMIIMIVRSSSSSASSSMMMIITIIILRGIGSVSEDLCLRVSTPGNHFVPLYASMRILCARPRRVDLKTSRIQLRFSFGIEQPYQENVGFTCRPPRRNSSFTFASNNTIKKTSGQLANVLNKRMNLLVYRTTLSRKRRVDLQTSQTKLRVYFLIKQPYQGNVGSTCSPPNPKRTLNFAFSNPTKETSAGFASLPIKTNVLLLHRTTLSRKRGVELRTSQSKSADWLRRLD